MKNLTQKIEHTMYQAIRKMVGAGMKGMDQSMNTTQLRFEQAQASIRKGFLTLLQEKPFHKITATEIIKYSGVNRSTFYAHYVDKYNLMDKMQDEVIENIVRFSEDGIANLLENEEDFAVKLHLFINNLLIYIYDIRDLARILFGPNGDPAFLSKLHQGIKAFWVTYHISLTKELPNNYVQSAVIGIVVTLVNEWIQSGFDKSVEEFTIIVESLLLPIYKDILY